jgi:hypothetical protein
MNLPLFIGETLAITPPQEIALKPTKTCYERPKHKKNDIKRDRQREKLREEEILMHTYTHKCPSIKHDNLIPK